MKECFKWSGFIVYGRKLSNAMKRVICFLMAVNLSMIIYAHNHDEKHHDCNSYVCIHDGNHHHEERSDSQQNNIPCQPCQGKGICLTCKGAGKLLVPSLFSYYEQTCFICGGTGKCLFCWGTGVYVPAQNSTPIPNTIPDSNPINGSGTSNNYRNCSVCNGTGQKIKETWMGSGTSNKKWCNICNKSVLQGHQHVRCDNCHGTGKVKY